MPFSLSELPNCDPVCRACIKRYIKKHDLKKGDRFKIPCSGIKKQYLDNAILSGLADPETALSMYDPVLWAKKNLDWVCIDPDGKEWKRKSEDGSLPTGFAYWTPKEAKRGRSPFHRPYQYELLKCSSKRKVSRIGRQCLTDKALITLLDGSIKSIKDIKIGDRLLSLNQETYQFEENVVTNAWLSGKKEIYRIRTQFGNIIECSVDHPFLSARGNLDISHGKTIEKLEHQWISIKEGLKPGDKIATPIKQETFGNTPLEDDWPEFLGYFLADGSASIKQSAKFTNTTPEYLQEFTDICKRLGVKVRPYKKGNGYDLIVSNGHCRPNPIRDQLIEWGLVNIAGQNKFIPEAVFNAPRRQIVEFIRRLWAADGYISTGKRTGRSTYRTEIGNLQESKKFVEQIQSLMWRFGVHGYIKPEPKEKTAGYNWRYVVSNKISIRNFLDAFGPIPQKERAGDIAYRNLENLTDKYIAVKQEVLWDRVKSIEYIGEEETYDIEVGKHHNFIANGIITHNSGKSEALCIFILFKMFTESGYSVTVITPYQTQVELIYKRLFELLETKPELINSVKIRRKSPNHYIELHNGSSLKMFTAGTKSNAEAGVVRGAHANLLIFDEADMLSRGDLDSSLALIMNFPEAIVWMSSTPTGKRETFFKACQDDEYREFHYPSSVNPAWNEEKERFFRKGLTELGYQHECEAEFGEDVQGVYQKKYIAAAQAEYKYGDLHPTRTWIYSIGVDWNDNFGTVIRVVGLNPGDNCLYIVDSEIVKRDGWTQTDAVAKIVNMNRKWAPHHIYVDKGHGHAQVELLHGIGAKAMKKGGNKLDARLATIVKAYDFGSTVEVRDLFTKQPVKKPAKPFLVESSVRCFEDGRIKYPQEDEKYTASLEGYHIVRRTDAGIPKYGYLDEAIGDHLVDATNLAIVVFALEVGEFGSPKFVSTVAFSGQFGEHPEEKKKREAKAETARKRTSDELGQRTSYTAMPATFHSWPAANTAYDKEESGKIQIWSWPGWERDAPPPRKKRRLRFSRPRRTNI